MQSITIHYIYYIILYYIILPAKNAKLKTEGRTGVWLNVGHVTGIENLKKNKILLRKYFKKQLFS